MEAKNTSERATSRFSRMEKRAKSERERLRKAKGIQPSRYRNKTDRPSLCVNCGNFPPAPNSWLNLCPMCKCDHEVEVHMKWLEDTGRTLGGRKK